VRQTCWWIRSGRRLIACVDFVYGRPIVVGFVLLDGSQMGLTEQNREVHLHPSGACTMIAPDGSIETFHPGGGYVRIGTGDHQDLATVAAGGTWNTPAAPAPQITVATSGFKAIIAPGGQVTMTSNAGADVTFAGDVNLTTPTLTVKGQHDGRGR
jgi:hypothetical protein